MAVLINEDYEHFFVRNSLEDMTRSGLEREVDLYHKAGVDTVFFCVNAQSAYYDSKVYDTAWNNVICKDDGKYYHRDTEIPDKPLPTLKNTLHARAACENTENKVFQIRIDRCRHHGMKGGLSIRMNDCHLTDFENSPMHSDFWVRNPQYRLPGGGLDFGEKAVRDELKGLMKEVCEMFDADTLELDWMRTPPFFRWGREEEGTTHADEMVRYMYGQKTLSEQRFGHKISLYVRVPSRPEDALALGLDVVRWAKEGWIDGVIACAYILCTDTFTPQWIWRSLLPENVRFCPGMDVLTMPHSDSCGIEGDDLALEILTGYAAVFYYRGAEDLYMFNHFFAAAPWMNEALYLRKMKAVHSPEEAVKSPRRHVASCCCNMVPGKTFVSNLPLRGSMDFSSVRIEVGGGLENRKVRVLFAFSSPGKLDASDFEFMVNETKCSICEDVEKYPIPGRSRHDNIPAQAWQRFVCEVPQHAVTQGYMIASFRTGRELDCILQWCEFDVEGVTE